MAAVGYEHVIMVIVAKTTAASLAQQERAFMKRLRPVFNIVAVDEDPVLHGQAARILGATTCDDVLSMADKVLRQARPRLSASSWTALVVASAAAGDRTTAAKIARRARMSRRELRKLRALPRLSLPCPVPDAILRTLQAHVRNQLLALPHFDRTLHFYPTLRLGKVCWSRSPMVDAIVAPSTPAMESIGPCQCAGMVGPRHGEHIVTRQWQLLAPCRELAALCGSESMAQRTFPTAQYVADIMRQRLKRWLVLCGYDNDTAAAAAGCFAESVFKEFTKWFAALSPMLIRSNIAQQRRQVNSHGLILVRIDRNPGRVMAMCVEAWKQLNAAVFTASPRYLATDLPLACDDDNYVQETMSSIRSAMVAAGSEMKFPRAAHATRPTAYWTVKQKSIVNGPSVVIKVRPIIAHSRHPCRHLLRRIGRVLSLLVQHTAKLVQAKRPHHAPMWQLHSGSREWIARLARQPDTAAVAEFDVEDCFFEHSTRRSAARCRFLAGGFASSLTRPAVLLHKQRQQSCGPARAFFFCGLLGISCRPACCCCALGACCER